jgi:hypothetical protein
VKHIAGLPVYDDGVLPSSRLFPGHRKAVPIRNDFLRFNRIIGGLRFRQEVAPSGEDKCTFPGNIEVFKQWFGKPCTPSLAGLFMPDLDDAGELDDPERIEWALTEYGDVSTVLNKIVDMEDGCASATQQNRTCLCEWCAKQNPKQPWLNEGTLRIEIGFVVYNPSHGLYSNAGVNFWFNRGGHIHKLINIRSAWSSLFSRSVGAIVLMLLADIIWLLMVLYVVANEGREIFNMIRAKFKPWYITIAEDYLAFWNFIDWVSMTLAFLIIMRFSRLVYFTSFTNDALGTHAEFLTSVENRTALDTDILRDNTVKFFGNIRDMLEAEEGFRFQLVLYPMVLMLRLFKSFAAQPRLAVITQTFVQAGSDIFHFAIVFLSVYICMCVNAVLFFGQDTQDFANFFRSFHTCFLVMMGDWDYEELVEVGRLKASVWFWMFQIIVVLVLQNIMLAILMEAYTRVKFESENSISLWDNINKIRRRWIQARKGQRVRLNDIWDALKKQEEAAGGTDETMLVSEERVLPDKLVEIVPNLHLAQAVRTLTDSQIDFDVAHDPPLSAMDMSENLTHLRSKAENSLVCAAFIDEKFQMYEQSDGTYQSTSNDADASAVAEAKQVHSNARRQQVLQDSQERFQDNLRSVKGHTKSTIGDLSVAVTGVLGDEMLSLERRQKQQIKTTEQIQAALQSLRSLALKLNHTCTEVCKLSESAFEESADVILDDAGGGLMDQFAGIAPPIVADSGMWALGVR